MNFGRQVQIFEILEFDWLFLALSNSKLSTNSKLIFCLGNSANDFFSGISSKVNCPPNLNKKYRSSYEKKK